MNELSVKVASKGEGKTKWLLQIANSNIENDKVVWLYTNTEKEYNTFCEKYFKLYNTVCLVKHLTSEDVSLVANNEVVLIDNIFNHNYCNKDVIYLQKNCHKVYITVEGTSKVESFEDKNQIKFNI